MKDKIIVDIDSNKQRLDTFLHNRFPDFTRSQIKQSIDNKEVLVNGKSVKAGYALKTGEEIDINLIDKMLDELFAFSSNHSNFTCDELSTVITNLFLEDFLGNVFLLHSIDKP